MEINGLKYKDDISRRLINLKKSPYIKKAIQPKLITQYEKDGWEVIPSNLKKSVRMQNRKLHYVAFSDRIWALFAAMEFDYLNDIDDEVFAHCDLSGWNDEIDILAIDGEAIIVVKCISSQERVRKDYKEEIGAFVSSEFRAEVNIAIQKLYPGKQKIAYIVATNNAVLSDNNRDELNRLSIWHFNQDAFEYFEQLSENLGFAAKYQLFGKLFENQTIPEIGNRVPAIKGKISEGYDFYSFSIEPETLLKLGYILHRTETNTESANTYQRLIKKSRLKNIGRYINEGGYFPNSIIINITTKRTQSLRFERANIIDHDSTTNLGVLYLPKRYRSAFIIDGQHRLYGYTNARGNKKHLVPVVAFHNLPLEEQTKIFVDINHQQKSVPANLLRSIMADFNWNSENARAAISALKTRLLTAMNYDENSPLYKRIVIAEEKKTEIRCLTLQTLLNWGINTKVNFFGVVKGTQLEEKGYLSESTYELTLKKSLAFFNKCFRRFEEELNEQWQLGSSEGGFIAMNIGISSIFRVTDNIIKHLIENDYLNPQALNGDDLANEVIPYFDPIIEFIRSLDSEEIKSLRGLFGSGATQKVTREFQNAIHQQYSLFAPDGLEKWIKDSSGEYTPKAYELGHSLESQINEFIKFKLKQEFGEDDWWQDGISISIQKKCSEARIEKGSKEPDWHFLNTIHYHDILMKQWTLFESHFTKPSEEQIAKVKKLNWLKEFNSIRQKYSHPQRENVTEEDYENLVDLSDWLGKKINISPIQQNN